MTRKTFAIRHLKATPPGPQAAGKYLRHWHAEDLYHRTETFPRITSRALFDNDRPFELEIGPGTGEFLCLLASLRPEINFVGIDVSLKSCYIATHRAVAMGLENILFIKAPAQMVYPLLEPDSLSAVYLHFPEPSMHPKFRGRRIFTEGFLGVMHAALKDGGHISVITDHADLYGIMLEIARKDGRYELVPHAPYMENFEHTPESRYRRIWQKYGIEPMSFVLRKLPVE